jgi:hypothetical protein
MSARRASAATAAIGLLLGVGACGDTLQNQPIGTSSLEQLIMVRHFPVYWLGTHFEGLAVASVTQDPSGAYMIEYGNCAIGGQYTCVSPLELITNPDNSFIPGGGAPHHTIAVRGVPATLTLGGRALELRTGSVLVVIYARTRALARAAAERMTPINQLAAPGAPLPAPLPDTGFARRPLFSQTPSAPGALAPSSP